MKIRYKYRPIKQGFELANVNCPTCKSNHINWVKPIQDKYWNGTVFLLAECWSGDLYNEKPKHLFYIKLNENSLPIVELDKTKGLFGKIE